MLNKRKVLFFIPQLVGGGAEKVSINIMRILDKNKFEVHLVVLDSTGPASRYLSKDIILHDLEVTKTIFSIFKLRKFISELKPDILFSSLIRGNIAISLAIIGVKHRPFIVLRSPNSPKLLLEYNQMKFIQKYLLECAYKKADLVLAQTPEMKDEIIKYHGICKDKIDVFLNPIDTDEIDDKITNTNNPFRSENINVVAAGRITYQKGFDLLIKSFKQVVQENPLFRLYIIGEDDGDELKNLQNIIKELKLTEYIFFLGYQKNAYRYFYFSDLYVLSSRWEGLPNTVLENLYLHKPIVSTRCIPFMDTLIKAGENGMLVDVGDINSLANAILNYKNLTFNFSDLDNAKLNVNNLFSNIRM